MITREPVYIGVENPLTAFGELLVGQLYPQFQSSFEYTVDNTEIISQTKTNGGTVTQSSGMAVISTSTTTDSNAMLSSKQRAKYKSGLGGVLRFTVLFNTPVVNTEQYIGLMDKHGSSAAFANGYVIGYDGTTFGYHRFQNDSKTTTSIANWDDPLDGNGASGETINQTKLNIFYIRYQYLGGGAINVCFEKQNGNIVIVHTDKYAGLNTEPSTHNPNFRFHMHVHNLTTTTDIVMKTSSYSYFVEGKTDLIELHQPQFSTNISEKTSVTSEVAIVTIRNKATYVSKTNFIDILLEHIVASIEANAVNNLGSVRLIKNTTLGGTPSYTDIDTNNSVVDFDTAGTTITGGKHILSIPLAGKNDKIVQLLKPLKIILNAGETLTLAGTSSNSATINGELLWKELF